MFDMPLTSSGSGAFTGSWLSISISPLCVILVIGRLSASLCSFSIISIVCEMRNVLLLKDLHFKKKETLMQLAEPNFHIRIIVCYRGELLWVITLTSYNEICKKHITDLIITYMSVLPFSPSSQFF